MRGPVGPLRRKNGWTPAEEAGYDGPDRIERMLNRIEWDADRVLDDVRDHVVEHLGDRDAVLILDDTGFLKKGTRSAGAQRQYSGTADRTENCQADRIPFGRVTVDSACGSSKGRRFEREQADVFHVMATMRHDTVVTCWAMDHPVHNLFPVRR